jgi:hypothetical protein
MRLEAVPSAHTLTPIGRQGSSRASHSAASPLRSL